MGTSYNQIEKWYKEGKKNGYKYMTVIYDTFDWTGEDFNVNDFIEFDNISGEKSLVNGKKIIEFTEKAISSAIEEREKEIVKELKTWFTDEMEDDPELSEWGKGKRKGYNRAIDQIILFIQPK
jgi:hypothetical protein